jgi:trigger factor
MTPEQFEETALTQATNQVTQSLVIEAVAQAEKLVADPAAIASRYEDLAAHYSMPVEEIKKYVNDALVANDITFGMAIDLIVDSAKLI